MSLSTKAGPSSAEPVLEVRGISKSFPGVRALKDVDLRIWPGEVHALMGENGAGKSTLMKILAGAYHPDSGEILLDGKPVQFRTPYDARAAGIGIIYQELTVAPNLTVHQTGDRSRGPIEPQWAHPCAAKANRLLTHC